MILAFIEIRKPRDVANVNKWKIMFDPSIHIQIVLNQALLLIHCITNALFHPIFRVQKRAFQRFRTWIKISRMA